MQPKSLRNLFSFLLLLPSVFLPFGSSLSFNFPSFNKSTPTFVNLGGNASLNQLNQVIELTKNELGPSGTSSTGRAVYPQPLLLWDSVTRSLTNFTTHFSFKIVTPDNTCSCSGLAFFLSPYPFTPPDISSGGYFGLFSEATAHDTTKNQLVAVEFGTSHNKLDTSKCHVGIDVNSIDSPVSANCVGEIASGQISNATISYNSRTRNLTVFVVPAGQDVSDHWMSLWHVVDLRNILPAEVAVGFSATAKPSSEPHQILSWDFSSTLLAPAPALAAPLAQPTNDSKVYVVGGKLNGKINLLTGLVSSSLGAVIGSASLVLLYKMIK